MLDFRECFAAVRYSVALTDPHNAVVARHIFERHPHLSPGGLTLLKGAMVSNRALAAFCVHAGLHRHLVLASDQLANAIAKYVEALEARRSREYELATRENRLPGQYWLDLPMEPPKVSCNTLS